MKAMVLAAGFGTRLGEITRNTPKCLVNVAGKPILERVVAHLRTNGVTSLAINTHYLAEQVEEFVVKNEVFQGLEVKIFRENPILGTGGGLKNAAQFLSENTDYFLVHNADIYEEFNLDSLVVSHKNSNALATLAVLDKQTDRCVLVDNENRWQCRWQESSGIPLPAGLKPFTFSGVQCVSAKVFQYMDDFEGEFEIFPVYSKALEQGEIIKVKHMGQVYYVDVGTPRDLEALCKRFTEPDD